MEWKREFQPQEGYWLRLNAAGFMELVWLSNVDGVWIGLPKNGGDSCFHMENGIAKAELGCQFKGPYIF